MKWAVIVGVLALAGCQTQQIHEMNYSERKALADQIVQRCIDQGVDLRSKEFEVCSRIETQAEHAKRQNNLMRARRAQMAAAQGMANASRSYSQSANGPINCRSVRAPDGAIRTTCY